MCQKILISIQCYRNERTFLNELGRKDKWDTMIVLNLGRTDFSVFISVRLMGNFQAVGGVGRKRRL